MPAPKAIDSRSSTLPISAAQTQYVPKHLHLFLLSGDSREMIGIATRVSCNKYTVTSAFQNGYHTCLVVIECWVASIVSAVSSAIPITSGSQTSFLAELPANPVSSTGELCARHCVDHIQILPATKLKSMPKSEVSATTNSQSPFDEWLLHTVFSGF
jgi:hypothetical protein